MSISEAFKIISFIGLFLYSLIFNPVFSQHSILGQFYSSNYIPPELNETSANRIDKIVSHYSKENKITSDFNKKEYERFVYRSNYFLEKLNKSGNVFYGDTISLYLNDLKNFLLDGHPKQKHIKVYLTRTPSFNAFTNDFGNIYVNVSAIAKMESEEELMALLSHEISHIILQHTHDFEEFMKNIDENYWKDNTELGILRKHSFSRKQEYEADLEGFKLLKQKGVNLTKCVKIFSLLRYDLNPSITGKANANLIASNNQYLKDYIYRAGGAISGNYNFLNESESKNDSLQTHPLTNKREEVIIHYIDSLHKTGIQNGLFRSNHNFQYYKGLANEVLLHSYLTNEWYIESLDQLLKLRSLSNEHEEYFIKMQAKLLTLITQAKYKATSFDQFLNEKGNAFNDMEYIEFKELILKMNCLEFNLMALISINELIKQYNIPYLLRCKEFLIKFLYKNNEKLFVTKNNMLVFPELSDINSTLISVNELIPFYNLTSTKLEIFNSLVQKEKFKFINVNKSEQALELLKYYVTNFPLTNDDRRCINQYKFERDQFEKTLTFEKFMLQLHPKNALEHNHNGIFFKADDFNPSGKTALVQTSNIFLKNKNQEYFIDYKKSLKLEKDLHPVFDTYFDFSENYSNTNISNVTVNYMNHHHDLLIWISERYEFDDLIYSKVDEQIEQLKKEKNLKYTLLNINVGSKAKKEFKSVTYSYLIYFDLYSGGVTYVSKIASKQKAIPQLYKQLFYLSKLNMK